MYTFGFSSKKAYYKATAAARKDEQLKRSCELAAEFKYIKMLEPVASFRHLDSEIKLAEPDPLIAQYAQLHPPPILDFDPERHIFVRANNVVQMDHLKRFDRAPHTPDSKYQGAIDMATRIVKDVLKLETPLEFPDRTQLAKVPYYPGKFPGMYYARKGLRSREAADPVAQVDALNAFDRLLRGGKVDPHDVRLGGRGKEKLLEMGQSKSNPPAVGRLILMLSHRDLKLLGVTENVLTQQYLDAKYPIAIGQSWFHGGSKEFIGRMRSYERWSCYDATKYDSSINPWMVRLALSILREQFKDGNSSVYDGYWDFVFESLVRAPIYRDDGLRFQKEVGTTSGHSHNSLVQSIITLVLGYACYAILFPDKDEKWLRDHIHVEALGDDNITASRGEAAKLEVAEVAQVMQDAFKVDWFSRKSFSTRCLADLEHGEFNGVQFLGKFWYTDTSKGEIVTVPYRPAQETYLRVLFSEYGRNPKPEETWLRVLGNYLDAAGNREMERWLNSLLDWIEPKVSYTPTEWPETYKKMVSRDYSRAGLPEPLPVRMKFEQWLDLVRLPAKEYQDLYHSLVLGVRDLKL